MTKASIEELHARIDGLIAAGERRFLGLTGAPGSGKSTVARQLVERVGERAVLVPMDGFHLANSELARLGRSQRKGAEDTFDSAGYVALLRRLRDQHPGEIVYAPEFRREIEESVGSAIPVFPEHRLIVTEGNYLLLDTGNWREIRPLVDEVWYIDVDPDVRLERLIARHVKYGREEGEAREWVSRSDERNAVLIASTAARADLIIRLTESAQPSAR